MLRQVCIDNNLTWIEDPTNSHPVFWRNVIRQVMNDYPHLQEGIVDFSKTCANARRKAENEGKYRVRNNVDVFFHWNLIFTKRRICEN